MFVNHYKVLEVEHSANAQDVKQAYRRLVRLYHPDSGTSKNKDKDFHQIQEAYEVLIDAARRKAYDKKLKKRTWSNLPEIDSTDTSDSSAKSKDFQVKTHIVDGQSNPTNANESDYDQLGSGITSNPNEANIDLSSSIIMRLKKAVLGRPSEQEDGQSGAKRSPEINTRTFHFTVDALESIKGSERKVVLEESSGQRSVLVKIPQFVTTGTALEVKCPATAEFPERVIGIQVKVEPHPYVEHNGADIVVKVPITVGEALNGTEVMIPTLDGSVKVRIPARWDTRKKLRLKGRGRKNLTGGQVTGDLFVQAFIKLPKNDSDTLQNGADAIDQSYDGDVRAELPQSLSKQ